MEASGKRFYPYSRRDEHCYSNMDDMVKDGGGAVPTNVRGLQNSELRRKFERF